jgi:hypothetical protein
VLERRRLELVWENRTVGTSPVVAGGLLYVYDPSRGGLNVYRPENGTPLARLAAGKGHWTVGSRATGVALPEGDSNDHRTEGVLNIYGLPR